MYFSQFSYKECDIVLVCFDTTNKQSLNNVVNKWAPEVRSLCTGIPFLLGKCNIITQTISVFYIQYSCNKSTSRTIFWYILVGTQVDKRQDIAKNRAQYMKVTGTAIVQHVSGMETSKSIQANGYFECSALTREVMPLYIIIFNIFK